MSNGIEKRVSKTGEVSYRVTVSTGYAGGKQQRVRRTVNGSYMDAKRERARLMVEIEQGKAVPSKRRWTVAKWAEKWLEASARRLAPRTVAGYREHINTRIVPALGTLLLAKVDAAKLRAFKDSLAEKGARRKETHDEDGKTVEAYLSPMTQARIWRTLAAMLEKAVEAGLIGANPCKVVKAPHARTYHPQVIDLGTIEQIVKALATEPPRFRAIVLVALGCGLRRGEIAGLRWRDVDYPQGLLTIARSSIYLPGKGQSIVPTKTTRSRRTVTMPPDTLAALVAWWNQQLQWSAAAGEKWEGEEDFVFTDELGRWLSLDVISKGWDRFRTRHKLPDIRFHDLRHAAASMLLAAGVPLPTVSEMLGHSSANVTLAVYAHALDAGRQQAADAMQRVLRQAALPAAGNGSKALEMNPSRQINPTVNPTEP